MKKRFGFHHVGPALAIFLCFLFVGMAHAQEDGSSPSPEGYWQTIPDDEGSPSVIHIWIEDGEVFGKVVRIYPKPGKDPDPICDQCTGDLKDQPIIGMIILSGLTAMNDEWSGGQILDPNNGKSYKCTLKLVENGARLKVRGYVGFSLLGRTQYWISVSEPD